MQLNLTRNIVFFDVETTGLNVIRDRILQIALVKIYVDGKMEELEMLINPGIPISEESMAIHGITPKDLANKPSFQQVSQQLFDFIGAADLGGYNSNRFDIPMLSEEFARVGLDFDLSTRRLIDVQRIFYKMEPRTLRAALAFYCQRELIDAHDAMADVRATLDVFKGQLQRYDGVDFIDADGKIHEQPIKNDIQVLHDFTNDASILDVTMRLKYDANNVVVFNFGKFIGQPVGEVVYKDRQYYHWIQDKEFSHQVKKIVKELLKAHEEKLKQNKG